MPLKLHFISGLPRSGSTLLAAILRQNPRFHASVESPLSAMCMALSRSTSGANEASIFISDEQRRKSLIAVVNAFYGDMGKERTVFDNSRQWCRSLPLIGQISPESRVICCVRNIAWILDSVERLVQKHCLSPSRVFNHEPGGDAYTRAAALIDTTGFVGSSLRGLRQAWFGEHASRLIAVRYDSMTGDPELTMKRLYENLGEEPFSHDFENIDYEEPEFDRYLGLPGMHTVKRRVAAETRETILPPDIFKPHDQEFWNGTDENPRGVTIL